MTTVDIAAFYRFLSLGEPEMLRGPILDLCEASGVRGTILLAHEGINGTIAGPAGTMRDVVARLAALVGAPELEAKYSQAEATPFLRMKVRLKREIVTIGDTGVDPTERVGTYVEPADWNALISEPDVLVIDARNDFEVRIGTFEGALDPQTSSFGEFPAFVRDKLDPKRHKRVAMFCTGGIRCEKASSLMLREGFEQVYHLKGGILNYLEKVAPEESLWHGACFVFDERVAVGHGLAVEDYTVCRGCLAPLSAQDRRHPDHEEGVACLYCADNQSEAQKASNRERHRQVLLARERGNTHLGPVRD